MGRTSLPPNGGEAKHATGELMLCEKQQGVLKMDFMKIVAHRGASGERPEHTLAAYELAVERQTDGIECDIRLTRDGQLICFHDRTIERTCVDSELPKTTVISELTLAELQELNFGTPEEPAPVLTLRELLELFQQARADGKGVASELFIETKHPNRYGPKVEYELHKELVRNGLADSDAVHLISFSPQSLVRFKAINPRIHRILLRREYQRMLNPGLEALHVVDAHGLSVARGKIRPDIIGRFGDGTYMWTADKEDDVRWAARRGVTWLATNYPGRARMWRDDELAG